MGAELPSEEVCGRLLPMLIDIQADPVANVRLNVAKAFAVLKEKWVEVDMIVPLLEGYCMDADRDVRFFAKESLEAFRK